LQVCEDISRELAPDKDNISLHVATANVDGRAFYEQAGFEKTADDSPLRRLQGKTRHCTMVKWL
jgi:ribosomal protein S18 acetylase RimI-like enzyme